MDFLITKRFPCSVCGLVTVRHDGWFLVLENRWLDHLKILTWHPLLAPQKDIQSACCRQHLKALIAHWLEQATLRPQADSLPTASAGYPARMDLDLDPDPRGVGRLLGELSVHRETFSRSWTGSPATLECILDALMPVPDESDTCTMEFQLVDPHPGPLMDSPFTKALADLHRSLPQV